MSFIQAEEELNRLEASKRGLEADYAKMRETLADKDAKLKVTVENRVFDCVVKPW